MCKMYVYLKEKLQKYILAEYDEENRYKLITEQ